MSAEVRAVSRANKAAFQSGDKEAHNTTRARLKAAIKEVKTSAPTALKICSRRSRTTPEAGVLGSPVKCIPPPEDQLLSVSTADVRKILLRVKVSKAELLSSQSAPTDPQSESNTQYVWMHTEVELQSELHQLISLD